MNVLVVISLLFVEVTFITFAVVIIRSGLKEKLNRTFLFFLLSFAVWAALNYFSNLTTIDHMQLLIINRLLFVISLVGLYALAQFTRVATNQSQVQVVSNILFGVTIAGAASALTSLVVNDIIIDSQNSISVGIDFGILSGLYFFVVLFIAVYILVRLIRGVQSKTKKISATSKTLLLTIGLATVAIIVTNVILPVAFNNFDYSIIGLLFGTLMVGGVGYAVVRHGLFDVRLAVVRSVTYTLVLVTLAGLYLIAALAFSALFDSSPASAGQTVSGVVISLILAFVFQPIRRFFDKITNKIFYKENYNTDDFFSALNRILTSTTDLRGLLNRTAIEIGTTLKSEQAFFFINTLDGHHITAGTPYHTQLPKADTVVLDSLSVSDNHGVIVASERKSDDSIRRLMVSHKIELILPLKQGDENIGYLCLGEHLISTYTNRDLKVLSTVSDELVIAIQNALSVREVRELNDNLQQRVNDATKELRASNAQLRRLDQAKDEFVSMASHQLRTPLTSVKGYISMVMEGDVGKITDSQKHLLGEAFTSSERMVHLINDFLNVSRLQTGKFLIDKHPVDLAKLVQSEIDSLETTASSRNLEFTYKAPKNVPILNLDQGKMEQVIMNFADNAIYYSAESTHIAVKLVVDGDDVVFTVKDTGIGVPKMEQSQLFSKFYRASNARKQRPDGTGVGLFLAKKVIVAHGGSVVFESLEGKGSTFGFRLPIAALRAGDDTN